MAKFITEFELLLDELHKMGKKLSVSNLYKIQLLLTKLDTNLGLESSVTALRRRDVDDRKWESVVGNLL